MLDDAIYPSQCYKMELEAKKVPVPNALGESIQQDPQFEEP
jgi:hypothetical protein